MAFVFLKKEFDNLSTSILFFVETLESLSSELHSQIGVEHCCAGMLNYCLANLIVFKSKQYM
jgi:hypothetical protein